MIEPLVESAICGELEFASVWIEAYEVPVRTHPVSHECRDCAVTATEIQPATFLRQRSTRKNMFRLDRSPKGGGGLSRCEVKVLSKQCSINHSSVPS